MQSIASADIAVLVKSVAPFDELEAAHRVDALAWLASTGDIFRRVPPPKHLVAYFVLQDPADGAVLLVHHRKAGLWFRPAATLRLMKIRPRRCDGKRQRSSVFRPRLLVLTPARSLSP